MHKEQEQLLTAIKDAVRDVHVEVVNALRKPNSRIEDLRNSKDTVRELADRLNQHFPREEETKAKTLKKRGLYGEADCYMTIALESFEKAEQERTTLLKASVDREKPCMEFE